jgi:CubicO group peptidase (beta-lactamase class C family)
MKKSSLWRVAPIVTLCFTGAIAQTVALPPPDSVSLDNLGYMQTFPPSGAGLIDDNNRGHYPQLRWTLQHAREVRPTRNIWRGTLPPSALPLALMDLGNVAFDDGAGKPTSILQWQKDSYTDGLIVLHKGKVVYERYDDQLRPETPHLLFSVTKSFTGLLAAQLIHDGKLDPDALVTRYVPELAGSAWEDMKVREVMDMTGSVNFREDYTDPTSDVFRYAYASEMLAPPPGYQGPLTVYDYLKTLKKGPEPHGAGFVYRTVNSEVLGWIVSRITGKHFADLLSDRVWTKLGMQEDAYVLIDPVGTPLQGAGLNATLRDVARFGEMVRLGGQYNGQRVFDQAVIDDLRRGGDREKFKTARMPFRPGYSYHNQWWIVHNADGAFEAAGLYGQMIHINPSAEMVIVKLSSHPIPGAGATQATTIRAFEALANAVRNQP